MRDGREIPAKSLSSVDEDRQEELINLVEEIEDELIELDEDKREPEELIVLLDEEGPAEEFDETLIELEEDEPSVEEELIELFDEEVISGLERIEDDLDDFFSGMSDIEVLLDEDEEMPANEESVSRTREGINISPTDSLNSLIDFSSMRLQYLEESINSNLSYNDNNSREMLYSVMDSRELPFLTPEHQARLLTLVEGFDSEEQVVNVFLASVRLDKRQQLELSSYVRQVMARYRLYLEKSEVIASIRSSMNRFIIQRYVESSASALETLKEFAGLDTVSYVKWVKAGKDKTEFACGNCDHTNVSDKGFFKVIVSERSFNRNEHLTLFPLACVCSSCGHLNIFTFMEHQSLNNQFNKRYENLMVDWRRGARKLSSFGNVISYEFKNDLMTSVKPDVFIKEPSVVEEPKEVTEHSTGLMYRWYLETLKSVQSLTSRMIDNKGGFSVKEGKVIYDKVDMRDTLWDVAVLYCNMMREDFSVLRTQAVNSLLLYFKNNPALLNSLNTEYIYKKQALVMHREYLQGELDPYDAEFVYKNLCKELGLEFDSFVYEGEVDSLTKEAIEGLIDQELRLLEQKLEQDERNYVQAIESLEFVKTLFRFVDIKQTVSPDLEDLEGLLVSEPLRAWIDEVSILMIINYLSDSIADFWKTLSIFEYKNKSIMESKRVTKTSQEQVGEMISKYTNNYKELGSKSSPKFMISDFLSYSFTDMRMLSAVYDLKSSVESLDYYNFAHAIVKLSDGFEHKSDSFRGIKELLRQERKNCQEFVDKLKETTTGSDTLDYYRYHYGDLFSLEEITEASKELHGFMKPYYYLPREDGENFSNYLKRLRNSTYEENISIVDKDREKFKQVSGYYLSIYGMFEYFKYCSGAAKERIKNKVLMNDVVYYSYFFGKRFMFDMLGLVKLPVSTEDSYPAMIAKLPTLEDHRYRFILDNLIYTSVDMNNIANGEDESGNTLVDLLKEDPEGFKESLKYFSTFGEQVIEYYIS
jgi:hypothetical protein